VLRASRDAAAVRELNEDGERERVFDLGYKQIARLAEKIEADTGCAVEGRRALELGCGVGRLALPLAERCEYVYGVDVSKGALREAAGNAELMNASNVEWAETSKLEQLSGSYDLVISVTVFQHIRVPEGERIFRELLSGLRPGGIGALNFILRPDNRVAAFTTWTKKAVSNPYNPVSLLRGLQKYREHMNTYSLHRLGGMLAEAGIKEWHTHFIVAPEAAHDAVIIVFRKD
jgi:cyclopropane fatty-acyl-phospholipid synthase-like methyltransferase